MSFKKRSSAEITVGTSFVPGGSATGSEAGVRIGLGYAVGRIHKIEVKGDDANVEATATILVTDTNGRIIFSDSSLDFGTDDSTAGQTEQDYSTVGLGINVVPVETEAIDRLGDPAADTEGVGGGIFAVSPIDVVISSGTDGDKYKVHVFVEG